MFFQCINICQVPWELLKTEAGGFGFQHLPRDLGNVNAWKTMFDPYSVIVKTSIEDVQEEPQSQNIDYQWQQEKEQTKTVVDKPQIKKKVFFWNKNTDISLIFT